MADAAPVIIPNGKSVYYHFRVWSEGTNGGQHLDRVLQKLVKQIRTKDLRPR